MQPHMILRDSTNATADGAQAPGDDELAALYARHARPRVAEMMRAVRLDVRYHRAAGDWLHYYSDQRELAVLDALGGYGSTLFGHNHPALVATLIDGLRDGVPFAAQASLRGAATRLAARLSARFEAATGRAAVVTLGNSGAEATEAARKHATLAHARRQQRALSGLRRTLAQVRDRVASGAAAVSVTLQSEWPSHFGRPAAARWQAIEGALLRRAVHALGQPARFVALAGSFHGKTGGALALTHGENHRQPFRVDDARVDFVDPFAPDAAIARRGRGALP